MLRLRRSGHVPAWFGHLHGLALLVLLVSMTGCVTTQKSPPATDDGRDKEADVRTIGELTSVANVDPMPVSGVGLVVGLDGTGGDAPPGTFRDMLEKQLRKQGYEKVRELLASPSASLVLVSGLIPAGAHKGDPIDLEVTLPPQSHTRSLRGGHLVECYLYDYENARDIAPTVSNGDGAIIGHMQVKAQGPVQIGLGDGDESVQLKQGKVWSGGRIVADRPVFLMLNNDDKHTSTARMAQAMAERINDVFHGTQRGTLTDVAVAKTNELIILQVPAQYRHNLPRYLRVIRLVPLHEEQSLAYRRKLKEDLLDPAKTITAALRLEALGADSIPDLKLALQSEHVLVRFAAAEALAYLGSPASGDELAALVEQQLALRSYCLTALASLDEAICHVKLHELLASARSETRYGAFRALRALDETDDAVQGELLNESFWLHRVVPQSPSLVHLSTNRRAEIVLFGQDPRLVPPFSFLAGPDFTVTAVRDDDKCIISRFSVARGAQRRQCSLKLHDVLTTLAELGGSYPDAVELLRQAGKCKCLSCELAVDALPQAVSIHDLARSGAEDPEFQKSNAELLSSKSELGATPTLFERKQDSVRRSQVAEEKSRKADDKSEK